MWLQSVSFAAGVLLSQQLPDLPGWLFSLTSLILLIVLIARYQADFADGLKLITWSAIGFFWSVLSAHWQLSDKLPDELIKQPIEIHGEIIDLPEKHGEDWRFNFHVQHASFNGQAVDVPEKIRLSWYRTEQELKSGQTWQFQVKLKPPTGLRNFGLFDLEGWYFQNGIRARGYVINTTGNTLVEPATLIDFDSWREKIRSQLEQYNQHSKAVAITMALTLGDKSHITQEDWQVFRRLGINHLVAISGLHIGMVAMLAYWLSGLIWRLSARLCERVATPQIQAVSALFFATVYAGLAGFSLPTQRALIMLSIVLLSRLLLVNMQPYRQLFLAFFMVLIWQPSAIINAGFWLSFTAVAAIFYVLHFSNTSSVFIKLIKMQLVISVALMPLTLLFFQQASVVSPLVNLLLIPLFSFLVVPGALLTVLLSFWDHQLTFTLTSSYFQAVQNLLEFLSVLSTPDWLILEMPNLSKVQYLLILAAVAVGFFRTHMNKKISVWLVCGGIFPLTANTLDPGLLRLTVLDVGQGSAYLVQTSDKVLLYDLGPRYSGGSATRSVVIPYLQNQSISQIDQVIISHADSDHAGDVRALQSAFDVEDIYIGEPVKYLGRGEICHHADAWNWDDNTGFRFLTAPLQSSQSGNNSSCVLQVSHHGFKMLLTGDIEKKVEKQLVRQFADQLESDIVLVPHHGSRSSSTSGFVSHTKPGWVLNSSGYLNRYQFPVDSVKARWMDNGARFFDTASHGAIEFVIDQAGGLVSLRTFHDNERKYWHENRLADRPG